MKSLFFTLFSFAVIHITVFSQPLSDHYFIGGMTADYATFNDAVQDLITRGVDGPVIFSVVAGTYEEQVLIPQIQGASEINTITFQSLSGDSTDVVLQYNAGDALNNYVVKLDTTSCITIENISIVALDTLYGCAVSIGGGSQYITLEGNVIRGNGKVYPAIYSLHNDYLTIINNLVQNGQSGIYLMGEDVNYETGNYISGNTIVSPVNAGVYARYQWRHSILNNSITLAESQEEVWAGVSLVNCQGNINNKSLVANNTISCNTTQLAAGIEIYGSSYQLIYHNSILMFGSSSQSRSFDQESGGTFNEVKNNIFSNEAGGIIYYIENTNSFGSDNNIFYSPQGSFAYYNDFIDEFTQWKSVINKDLNSYQADPDFVSVTDLHIQQKLLVAKGSAQTLVLKDIDGENRDTIRPTPGADRLTVACGEPLAGGYAIGDGGDFLTFSDAVLALASCGVSEDVLFYVLPETYEEQIELSYIRNASDNDTVAFQSQVPDSTSVILRYNTDSLQNYVVKLSGIKNVAFRYITIQVTDTSGRAVVLENSIDNIIFDNDRIIGPSSTLDDNFNACVFFGLKEDTDTADIEFTNTLFVNGSYGIDFDFGSGGNIKTSLKILQNSFTDQNYAAIWLQGIKNTQTINYNNIQSKNNPFRGIYIAYSDSTNIACNKILLSSDRNCTGIDNYSTHNFIFNNFISIQATGLASIVGYSSTWPSNLFYNSILCYGDENYFSYCAELGTTSELCELKNNNFVNLGGGVLRISNAASSNYDFDHNNYYSAGSFFARNGDTELHDMQEWIALTGLDNHSVSINPVFVSTTDLNTSAALLNGRGTPVSGIDYDIEGISRDPVTPDIGAVEFNNPVFNAGNDTVFCYNEENGQYGGSHVYDIGYGYDSYLWSNGSDSSSVVIDSLGNDPGNIHYTVTVTTGGVEYNDNINIVYDLPDPIVQTEYCYWHNPLILAANPGYSWLWSTGDTTQSIKINEGDIYPELTVTDQYGCKNSETIHVRGAYDNYYARLNVSDTTIYGGQLLELTANDYEGTDVYDRYSFAWSNGNTMQDLSVDASGYATGSYEFSVVVYLTNDTLCSSSDTAHVIIRDQLGIDSPAETMFNLYPNPATEYVVVESGIGINTIEIYGIDGQFIESRYINDSHFVYDVSTLSKGTYIIKFNYNSGSASVKVQVE